MKSEKNDTEKRAVFSKNDTEELVKSEKNGIEEFSQCCFSLIYNELKIFFKA